jgi:DNA-binding transcriptional ArsR family regulator
LLVSRASVVSLVDGEEGIGGLASTDEAFVDDLYAHYERRWAGAEEFPLRTPARSEILSTLEQELGADTATDLERFLGSVETARGDGDGLDEVTISLLVAARNGKLLYDISKWGEDIGLASKATFSRTKTRLEETGLIDTEKVPIDVGRPRLRLVLGSGDLAEAEVAELAAAAQEQLA